MTPEERREHFLKEAKNGISVFGGYSITEYMSKNLPEGVNANDYWVPTQDDMREVHSYAKIILPVVVNKFLQSINYNARTEMDEMGVDPQIIMYDVFYLAGKMFQQRNEELSEFNNKKEKNDE